MSTNTVEAGNRVAEPAEVASRAGAKSRLLYLDNLRTTAITLVVLGHVAVSYGAEGDWYYHGEGQTSPMRTISASSRWSGISFDGLAGGDTLQPGLTAAG
jgi:hypothetical protein